MLGLLFNFIELKFDHWNEFKILENLLSKGNRGEDIQFIMAHFNNIC